jgi:hypothetical protein
MTASAFPVSLPRWARLALYAALLALPGGSIGVVLLWWTERRRAAGE